MAIYKDILDTRPILKPQTTNPSARNGACSGISELILEAHCNPVPFKGKKLLDEAVLLLLIKPPTPITPTPQAQAQPPICWCEGKPRGKTTILGGPISTNRHPQMYTKILSPTSPSESSLWRLCPGRRYRDSARRYPGNGQNPISRIARSYGCLFLGNAFLVVLKGSQQETTQSWGPDTMTKLPSSCFGAQ